MTDKQTPQDWILLEAAKRGCCAGSYHFHPIRHAERTAGRGGKSADRGVV